MKDITEFHIIGRIGKIDADKKVTHISVAANYNRFDGHSWKSNARWNRLTFFGELRDKLAKADIGDLVRVTGSIGQSSYKADGRTNYSVDLIVDSFAILAKARRNAGDFEPGERPDE